MRVSFTTREPLPNEILKYLSAQRMHALEGEDYTYWVGKSDPSRMSDEDKLKSAIVAAKIIGYLDRCGVQYYQIKTDEWSQSSIAILRHTDFTAFNDKSAHKWAEIARAYYSQADPDVVPTILPVAPPAQQEYPNAQLAMKTHIENIKQLLAHNQQHHGYYAFFDQIRDELEEVEQLQDPDVTYNAMTKQEKTLVEIREHLGRLAAKTKKAGMDDAYSIVRLIDDLIKTL